MHNFGCLNCSFALFLLCNEIAKKNYGIHKLTAETPPSPNRIIFFQAKMYLLCSVYVLFRLKSNFFWCGIFPMQLTGKRFI